MRGEGCQEERDGWRSKETERSGDGAEKVDWVVGLGKGGGKLKRGKGGEQKWMGWKGERVMGLRNKVGLLMSWKFGIFLGLVKFGGSWGEMQGKLGRNACGDWRGNGGVWKREFRVLKVFGWKVVVL
ncbi:hypothetical protein ACH5RR_013496 [Cinchona calisaya]|uniref:Uncharacterized protein n=1 Tax=Cinchona calisaya TaxID=153742 RepID=A0ABD3A1K6_9GENT